MSLYVLDTDQVTLYSRGHPTVTPRVDALPPTDLALTIITVEEQLTGWYTYLRKARDDENRSRAYQGLFQVTELIKKVRILPFEPAAIPRYLGLRQLFPRSGKLDLSIAAIVQEFDGILVTRNRSDFAQVPGLRIENWSQP